ncbi:MAG: hypothetical protein H0W12_02725 [Chitinophagaceae bacterium]|nr:hypothetical protein [Chitinophagaceae bacterium]
MNDAGGLWKLNNEKQILEHRQPILQNGKKFSGRFDKILFYGTHYAWCIGSSGLFQYDLTTNRLRKIYYPAFSTDLFGSNWINDIIRLNDGSYLFSTYCGLYRINMKEKKFIIEPFSELNKKKYTSFAALYQDENGVLYVKDGEDFLYVLMKSKESEEYSILKVISFLPVINQFYFDKATNYLLLATSHGLFQMDRNNYSLKKFTSGIPVPFLSISSMMRANKKLWLFGDKGLFCWDERNNTARTFTVEDGLPSNEFNLSALNFSSTGECIAATTNGLVSFFPDRIHDTIYPPLAQLTNIYINDASTAFVPNSQEINKINLEYDQNTFSFDFSPIAFQNAGECRFQYKLEGFDEHWIESGTKRYTRYSNIPPGKYLFQLQVIDANGRISPHKKTLEIEIAKAFWQTNIFEAAMLGLILFGMWLVLKWYLNIKIRKQKREFEKQQAIEKERTRIATDMHDDLGAGLSKIKYLSESIQLKKGNDEAVKNEVKKIASYSDEMVEKMGEIVWALNEKNDTLADLIAFTRSYAVEYLSNQGIQCIFCAPEILSVLFVTGETRRNIFLSVKESLHNVVKHSHANTVSINITIDKNLQVIIHDNGIGINKNHIRPFSNGLSNIKKRMEELKGNCEFENKAGTSVILNVPFHE